MDCFELPSYSTSKGPQHAAVIVSATKYRTNEKEKGDTHNRRRVKAQSNGFSRELPIWSVPHYNARAW